MDMVVDGAANKVIALELGISPRTVELHRAQIMAKLYRHNGEWKMHAIGENGNGRTIDELMPQITAHL